jgi:hypothetical protein
MLVYAALLLVFLFSFACGGSLDPSIGAALHNASLHVATSMPNWGLGAFVFACGM